MALMITKLKHKEDYSSVSLDEADSSKFKSVEKVEVDGEKIKVAEYRPYSNPVDSHRLKEVEVYNGDFENAPITVFTNRGDSFVADEKMIAEQLYEKFGEGRYRVFKIGGNPPFEPYFDNRFIGKISEEGGSS